MSYYFPLVTVIDSIKEDYALINEELVRAIQARTLGMDKTQALEYAQCPPSLIDIIWSELEKPSQTPDQTYSNNYTPQTPKLRTSSKAIKAIQAHTLGMTQKQAGDFASTDHSNISVIWRKIGLTAHHATKHGKVTETERQAREAFLREHGILEDIKFNVLYHPIFGPLSTMKKAYEFFSRLNLRDDANKKKAVLEKTLTDYPSLLFHTLDSSLLPKLQFLMFEIQMPNYKIAHHPELFTYSLDLMAKKYLHFAKRYNLQIASDMFNQNPSLFGYSINTLDHKIEIIQAQGKNPIDNFKLLTRNLQKVFKL